MSNCRINEPGSVTQVVAMQSETQEGTHKADICGQRADSEILKMENRKEDHEPTKRQTAHAATAAAKSFQSCTTLCDPIDGSPPVSPVPGILQARTLEWVAISFSNA